MVAATALRAKQVAKSNFTVEAKKPGKHGISGGLPVTHRSLKVPRECQDSPRKIGPIWDKTPEHYH
jgi:hypothetical protein